MKTTLFNTGNPLENLMNGISSRKFSVNTQKPLPNIVDYVYSSGEITPDKLRRAEGSSISDTSCAILTHRITGREIPRGGDATLVLVSGLFGTRYYRVTETYFDTVVRPISSGETITHKWSKNLFAVGLLNDTARTLANNLRFCVAECKWDDVRNLIPIFDISLQENSLRVVGKAEN